MTLLHSRAAAVRRFAMRGLALASLATLAACGGSSSDSGLAALGTRLAAQVSAVSANTSQSFAGKRSAYAVARTITGWNVTLYSTSQTTAVASSVTTLVFDDYTVNLTVADKAAAIPAADLKLLVELYIAFFNRVPDADGLAYWIDQRKGGMSLETIGDTFYNVAISAAYSSITGYTPSMTNADFITIVYKNVLGRSSVDQGGLDYWNGQLSTGKATRGSLVKDILSAAHGYKGDATYGWVADLLDNKYTAGSTIALKQGLTSTAADAYAKAVAIAALVTPTDSSKAIAAAGFGDTAFDQTAPLVSGVTLSTPMYRKLATITLNGAGLVGAKVSATNCDSLAESAGGSGTQRIFTCLPGALGQLNVTVQRSSDNAVVGSASGTVPAPQVNFKLTIGSANGTGTGEFTLELNPTNAPLTTNNFLQYVNDGFYTGTIFHRVIKGFVVQGGGFNANLAQLPTRAAIKLEWPNGLSNLRGTVAMARTGVLDSATSQFFVNTVDNLGLDTNGGGYAVFGKVVSGMTTIDAIENTYVVDYGSFASIPYYFITVTSATQVK